MLLRPSANDFDQIKSSINCDNYVFLLELFHNFPTITTIVNKKSIVFILRDFSKFLVFLVILSCLVSCHLCTGLPLTSARRASRPPKAAKMRVIIMG